MKTRRKKNNIMGSTHTFVFTHAPIVRGTISGRDATHISPHEYRFVDWVMNKKPEKRPNVEAVFCGHTHMNVWDYIKGLKGIYPDKDRDIDVDLDNERTDDYSFDSMVAFPYTVELLNIQMPRSTGG